MVPIPEPSNEILLRQLRRPAVSPLIISASYFVVGAIWIWCSDLLVEAFPGPDSFPLQTLKGWMFIGVTSVALFFLLYRRERQLRRGATALQRSEAAYRAVVEAAAEGIATLTADGRVTFINPRMRELLGVDGPENLSLPMLIEDEQGREVARSVFNEVIAGASRRLCFALNGAGGRKLHCEVSLAPMRGEGGEVEGAALTLTDVTERLAAEAERDRARAQLEEAERMTALGRLASSLAHEFNNVLMGILPFVEVIRRVGAAEPKIETATTSISRAVERGKAITHDILGFTRLGRPAPERLDLGAWLPRFAEELRTMVGRDVDVGVDIVTEPAVVWADSAQLRQVVLNLVQNARDAMPSGGKITLRVGGGGSGPAAQDLADPERFVRIDLRDDGTPIAPEDRAHLFEPLAALKGKRERGLALPLAHQIVVNHGGRLLVRGGDAETRFTLFLPRPAT